MTRFELAPMDGLVKGLTLAVLVLPPAFLVMSFVSGPAAPVLLASAVFVVALYAGIWVFARPTAFEVDSEGLHIVFPAWRRTVPRSALRTVEIYAEDAFRQDVGWGARVGSGGLFGAFGWLWTPAGWFEMYISRVRDLVVVRCEGRLPLLLSPVDPNGFAVAVEALLPEGQASSG